ncbi:type II toxin-antitoxin system RelE/ParE family toxin (plasmid) [Alicyclobacillus fastidiosus]|uniref:Type II toxin-antitoxin system RelE/ParE family toxin n=1 Tax=Alicyclobacillus fastidiosus TaxID=392011 RepID=A0ABY6ZSR3_9BACL|nr:type II toxin-antitoxin system RelE/ParE family toxin [Alicyclobacillus fastidiosus]WAH44990.1 type II toxin-antitoxin system RelE/ParE family toxin [Alicyclobacillus fastidiosus]GMA66265.1 plasmid stabilization system protein [Alicyclobacillus fastidiosus]GMA66314.1 plasmid stabilization system protein [Alicyclobacillus fastidiosus]
MKYDVEWSRQSIRDLRRLDKPTTSRIVNAVEMFAHTGHGDVKKLTNAGGQYRLRVGDWRVRFTVDTEVRILGVLRVLPRGEAYKR